MKKNSFAVSISLHKSVAFFISLLVLFSAASPIASAATSDKKCDNTEFSQKAAAIISRYDLQQKSSRIGLARIASNESFLRIIGKARDINSIDFNYLGAVDKVFCRDGRFVLQFADEQSLNLAEKALADMPGVLYFCRDCAVFAASSDTEPAADLSWGTDAVEADLFADSLSYIDNSRSVTVAVIDSGAAAIPFIESRLVGGYDFVDNDTDTSNDIHKQSHGTFLSCIIADCTKNLPIKIMPVRVLSNSNGSLINAVNGIYYAVDNGADVINISLCGIIRDCTALDDALSYAESKNAAVVVSAGNFCDDASKYCPAHNPEAITVTAVDSSLEFARKFSNYGECVDICAPGVKISSLNAKGETKTASGTSEAAAFVSAAAAMVRLKAPSLSSAGVKGVLKRATVDLGEAGEDSYYGTGFLKLSQLLKAPTLTLSADTVSLKYKGKTNVEASIISTFPELYTVKYISSNEGVATVSENGAVAAVGEGTAVITAQVYNADGSPYTDSDGNFVSESLTVKCTMTKAEKALSFVEKLIAAIMLIIKAF